MRQVGIRRAGKATGLVLALAGLAACAGAGQEASGGAGTAGVSAARGDYIVNTVGGCHDCHTPFRMGPNGPEPDMSLALSGHPETLVMPPPPTLQEPWQWAGSSTNTAFAGPWGVSFAANLTPDQNTGMGIWTEDMFVTAMKTGRHMGTSRTILPPMPWAAFGRMTEDDLKSVFAYLRTLAPITNHVPDPLPPSAAAPAD